MIFHGGFLILSLGAVVNKSTPDNEYTALSLACIGGHLKVVEFLLQNGANAAHKLKVGRQNMMRNVLFYLSNCMHSVTRIYLMIF